MKFLLRGSAMAALFFAAACSSTNTAPPPAMTPMPANWPLRPCHHQWQRP